MTERRTEDQSQNRRTQAKDERAAKADANAERDRDMMQGDKSLAAGSGNTLGDGMTSGGADRVSERKAFRDTKN